MFIHQASPTTVANPRHDPRLEVNVTDFLLRRGYRFKGRAELRGQGDPVYERGRWLRLNTGDSDGDEQPPADLTGFDTAVRFGGLCQREALSDGCAEPTRCQHLVDQPGGIG